MMQFKNEVIEYSSYQANNEGVKASASSLVVEQVSLVGSEPHTAVENYVLKKLLRGPRYFDSPKRSYSFCSSDEENATFKGQRTRKMRTRCYLCGAGHSARRCKQKLWQIKRWFSSSKKGNLAIKHPNNDTNVDCTSVLCLKCGNTGHDMFSCSNEYDPSDLKEIQCYICNERGHLCCSDNRTALVISCYNCGQFGHMGLECLKPKEVRFRLDSKKRHKSLQQSHKNSQNA